MILRKKPIRPRISEADLEKELCLALGRTDIPLSRFLWLDIETTGLSSRNCPIYLIGCVRREEDGFVRYQFLSRSTAEEPDILSAFLCLCADADCLVSFNGDTFDLPYLQDRCRLYGLPGISDRPARLDMLKLIRPWRRLLGLSSCRQKDLERYLGLFREDKYTGGELIDIYREFSRTGRDGLYDLLMLHNGDDMDGMMELGKLLAVPLFFTRGFTLQNAMISDRADELTLDCLQADGLRLPRTVSVLFSGRVLRAEGDRLTLRLPLCRGPLKYFYPNYRDYYYLPEEDCAVHKSVGEYVDRDHRVRATAATCYTKKAGLFLGQPSVIYTPAFYETYKGRECFFLYTDGIFAEPERFGAYLSAVIELARSGKG